MGTPLMGEHTTTMRMRPPPRWLQWWRAVRYPQGSWPTAQSWPWWHHWYATLVPYRMRRAHHWYATVNAYFWIPCPLCGVEFGGHEWRQVQGKPDSTEDGTCICPRCVRDGRGSWPTWRAG